ncbi:MAG: hypothetical protein ACJ75J_02095, partial [Cytophagaceae bacterium]
MNSLRLLLGLILFLSVAQLSYSQKVIDKISKEACDCMQKINPDGDTTAIRNEAGICMGKAMLAHAKDLNKYYKMEIGDELLQKIQAPLLNTLFQDCNVFLKLMMSKGNASAPVEATISSAECQKIHTGKFRRANQGDDTNKVVEFTKNRIKEYDEKGQVVAESEIKWVNDCEYTCKLIHSTNEQLSTLFIGETMKVKILTF